MKAESMSYLRGLPPKQLEKPGGGGDLTCEGMMSALLKEVPAQEKGPDQEVTLQSS